MTDKPLGIYIHIPFCAAKCAYCDFYSVFPNEGIKDTYFAALNNELKRWGGVLKNRPIDTLYIGGGTPSLFGSEILNLINCVRENFCLTENAEITAEANPENLSFLPLARRAGVGRLSVGAQTFCDTALKSAGRRHTAKDTEKFVFAAQSEGFFNLSLDLMLGLPGSDISSLDYDINCCLSLNPTHISAYILKKEKNTAFYHFDVSVPDDEQTASQYLHLCKRLEDKGFSHYEISNFCLDGYASRHNLKYWQTKEYLGVGPGAHSFLDGKRFFYPRDIKGFILSPLTVKDGTGGDKTERAMLGLRLKEGISLTELYGEIPDSIKEKTALFKKHGLLETDFPFVRLTDKGMLLSNSIITELIL